MELKYFHRKMDAETLKKRYRELAFQHHPDKGGDTAVMQQINQEFRHCMKAEGFAFDDNVFIKDFGGLMACIFKDMDSRNVFSTAFRPSHIIIEAMISGLNVLYKQSKFRNRHG